MTTVLALLIIGAAILCFFLDEILSVLKKIYEISAVQLVGVPLIIASICSTWPHLFWYGLTLLQQGILSIAEFIYLSVFQAKIPAWFVSALVVFLLSTGLTWTIYLGVRYKDESLALKLFPWIYIFLWSGLLIIYLSF